ncbi:hypothetical protein LTR43_012421, partial [Exophiala xenobiotica]
MYARHETTGIPKQYELLVLVEVTRNSAGQADADMNGKNIPPCAYFGQILYPIDRPRILGLESFASAEEEHQTYSNGREGHHVATFLVNNLTVCPTSTPLNVPIKRSLIPLSVPLTKPMMPENITYGTLTYGSAASPLPIR